MLLTFNNPSASEDDIFKVIMECDPKQNAIQFNKLAEQCAKNNVVPFIGAGMSIPIYKSWPQLLRSLAEDQLFPGLLEDTNSLLANNDYEGAASSLFEKLGRARFFEALDIELDPKLIEGKAILNMPVFLLPRLFKDVVITTNFDKVLEYVYKNSDQDFVMTPSIVGSNSNMLVDRVHENKNTLIKLHGDIYDKQSLVLFEDQYEKTYNTESETFKTLKTIFTKKLFLFLGCSLEGDRTIQLIRKLKLKHFAFMQLPGEIPTRSERIKYLGDLGITPVWYPSEDKKHLSVEVLLKKLHVRIQEIQLYGGNHVKASTSKRKPKRSKNLPYKKINEIFDIQRESIGAQRAVGINSHTQLIVKKIISQCYINPYITKIANNDLYTDIESQFDFLDLLSKGNQILITGPPGIGKSMFLKYYFSKRYNRRPSRKILFWVTSSIIKKKASTEVEQLYQQLLTGDFSKSCHVILFIDGADEIFVQNTEGIDKFKKLLINCQKNKITVIVSCRESYYERNLSDSDFLHIYKVCGWKDKQIMDYAYAYLSNKKSFSEFEVFCKDNFEISDFLQNPFQLALLLCLFSDAKEHQKTMYRSFTGGNIYLLYDRFYKEWLNRELEDNPNQSELSEQVYTIHERVAITLFRRYNNPIALDKILTKRQNESGICNENAMKDFLNTEIESGKCIVTGFWHSTFLEYFMSKHIISAFLKGGNEIISLFEKNVFRHFVMDFIELGLKSRLEHELYQIKENLEEVYYNLVFADNNQLMDDFRLSQKIYNKATKIDAKKRYLIRDQVVFFIGKLPSTIVENSTVISYAYKNESNILVRISAATVSINHGIHFDIENDFINKLLYDETWDRTLRSWVVVYWEDVKNSDPYNYIDTGGNWDRIKQRRLQRLATSGEKSKKYINTRAIDLTQLYIFYRSRGWDTLTQEDYNIIINCSFSSSYSVEKRKIIRKIKKMFMQNYSSCNNRK